MSLSPSSRVGDRAARAIADEFARHGAPQTGLLVGAEPGSPVLAAALDALAPGDELTIVSDPESATAMSEHLDAQGTWVAGRTKVVTALADARPADVVMVAAPVSTLDGETAKYLESLRAVVKESGMLVLAVPARGPVAFELTDLIAEHGVAEDLVLRNRPPLRVHRLRFGLAKPADAEKLAPAYRPSSVPVTGRMHIDSNGVAAGAIALGAAVLLKRVRPKSKLWLVPALAAAPVAAFFRDPERSVPDENEAVVAASDGKVLSVEHITDDRFGALTGEAGTEWLRVAVFLSVLDVHVNRSPVAGRVVDVFRESGGYAPAMKAAAEHNVACYTVVDTPRGRAVVAQRTGLLARRIINRAKVGALVAKGERYGLIRFGSRTDIYLPADRAEALVAPGERVVGGETVVARWTD
ncbi:phosphatidylserine decarboxylase [Phytomonospora sp. NPDC050363]|uniref:phosphatidylserine decarboxylase n=1 Tax=Phytomonospora sp. NPDC050363 TaxID=3155642 RepID=UPI0033DB793E